MTYQPSVLSLATEPSIRVSSTGGQRPPGSGQSHGSGTYPAAGVAKRRVLIVEDDEPTRRLLAITLRRTYDVVTAADGVEGLEMATLQPPPDLVITDVMMPRLDGLTMVQEI